jgi:hypothetical protein
MNVGQLLQYHVTSTALSQEKAAATDTRVRGASVNINKKLDKCRTS